MDSRRKLLFVINPISGGTKKKLVIDAINSNIDSSKFDWSISYTAHKGHAKELAMDAEDCLRQRGARDYSSAAARQRSGDG